MGYLNNQVVTVDAILTTKGRELLAKNDGSFRITQFALADDEIDYTLYNPTHPSGSAFYGEAIQNMPLFLPQQYASNLFLQVLDNYPVSPYLGNKDDFMLWIHFMENVINKEMGKEELSAIEHKEQYYNEYKPKDIILSNRYVLKKTHIISIVIVILVILVILFI